MSGSFRMSFVVLGIPRERVDIFSRNKSQHSKTVQIGREENTASINRFQPGRKSNYTVPCLLNM